MHKRKNRKFFTEDHDLVQRSLTLLDVTGLGLMGGVTFTLGCDSGVKNRKIKS